jgi:hypothetical protein
MMEWATIFSEALTYDAFLAAHGSADQTRQWNETAHRTPLSDEQLGILGGFVRRMNVFCLAGAWCGDCAMQCPVLHRFSRSTTTIQLRFVDRDANPELADALRICGGVRVPVVVFLSEDFHECGRYGDRTLSRYRVLASGRGEPANPADPDSIEQISMGVVGDWLIEFERIQLMLRLSSRLRRLHGD